MTVSRRSRLTRLVGTAGLIGVLCLPAACADGGTEAAVDGAGGGATASPVGEASGSPTEGSTDEPTGEPTGGPSAETTPSSGATLDPELAVDPPTEFRAPLRSPDMLIYDQETLSEDVVEAIAALDGVTAVESISMAQISVENRTYNLAAVDPSTYRNWTVEGSAKTQAVWDRVAGGEIAMEKQLKKRFTIDEQGYVELGSGDDVPVMHVGAYAPQVEQVDAVVNTKWGEQLGMVPGNALLISTGLASPQEVRKDVQPIVRGTASVQNLDIVAREGLDTSVQQTAVLVGTFSDAVGTFNYTAIGGGRIAPDPAWVRARIMTDTVPLLGRVTCNKAIFPQLRAALTEIAQRGLGDEIHPEEYAGCYYPRFIAGSTKLSNHSFGTALDLNTPGNQRGTVGEMDRTVVAIFKKWGFGWGGDWRYTDPMHFELEVIVEPG